MYLTHCSLIILISYLIWSPVIITNSAQSVVQVADRLADSLELVDFYIDMDGQNWDSTWNLNMPMSTWYGVTLTNDRVSAIRLPDNNLKGQFTGFNLPFLTFIHLEKDSIHGELLDYQGMPRLNDIYLRNLELEGAIPDFSSLKNLRALNFQGNKLTGTIPDFSGFPNLIILSLSDNELTDTIPDFTNLQELLHLDLSSNRLLGAIPDFTQLLSLTGLVLSSNNLVGPIPNFQNLENLGHLDLSFNPIGGTIPHFLYIGQLRVLLLEGCQLHGEIPDFVILGWLSEFNCSHNQLTGSIPEFRNCPDLRSIYFNDNDLTGSIPLYDHLERLKALDCSHNRLSGHIPSFSQNSWLELLDCSDNFLSGTIPDFQNSHRLEYFNCDNNVLIQGCIPDFSNIPDLEYAYFNNIDISCVIPDFSDNIGYKKKFELKLNKLTFEHLLPNYAANTSRGDFTISPQDSFGRDTIIMVNQGDQLNYDLVVDDTVSSNIYIWFKDGQPLDTIVGINEISIGNVQKSDEGLYQVAVMNPIIPELTLYSRDIKLTVESTSQNISSDDVELLLLPNPAVKTLKIFCDEKVIEWIIYDLFGNIVLVGKSSDIDLSTLQSGVHHIKVAVRHGIIDGMFIKI